MKKDFADFIVTSWHFLGKPLASVPNELPLPWAALILPAYFLGGLAKNGNLVVGVIHIMLPAILGHAEFITNLFVFDQTA
jgi:hypothetical protein